MNLKTLKSVNNGHDVMWRNHYECLRDIDNVVRIVGPFAPLSEVAKYMLRVRWQAVGSDNRTFTKDGRKLVIPGAAEHLPFDNKHEALVVWAKESFAQSPEFMHKFAQTYSGLGKPAVVVTPCNIVIPAERVKLAFFIRLNGAEKQAHATWRDANSITWENLINKAIKYRLGGVFKEAYQLSFVMGYNPSNLEDQVRDITRYGDSYDYCFVVSSHGDPLDDTNKRFLGQNYTPTQLLAMLNKMALSDNLFNQESTLFVSCDWVHGARTPHVIYENEVEPYLIKYFQ